jgi:hypothetical protein
MLLNTSINVLRYRGRKINHSCPNGNAKAEGKRDKPRESTSTLAPPSRQTFPKEAWPCRSKGVQVQRLLIIRNLDSFSGPMVRSQPIFTNDVVVVDRLSRILTHVADTSAPFSLDGLTCTVLHLLMTDALSDLAGKHEPS